MDPVSAPPPNAANIRPSATALAKRRSA